MIFEREKEVEILITISLFQMTRFVIGMKRVECGGIYHIVFQS